jgi:hypothetical protein
MSYIVSSHGLLDCDILKMEAAWISETMVSCHKLHSIMTQKTTI